MRTFIISNILILSLLTLPACSYAENRNTDTTTVLSQDNSEQNMTDVFPSSEAVPEDSKYKDILLPEDIKSCIDKLSEGGLAIKGYEYDIDLDGKKELLCPFMSILKIYKKSENVIHERNVEGEGLHYVTAADLNTLQTFEEENEKYSYFYYKYNSGVMKCNILTAIIYDSENDMYTVENLLSWGKLDYEGEASQFSRSFFRKGWKQSDVTIGESKDDIPQEEFLEIYNKYENLPPWDEFLD